MLILKTPGFVKELRRGKRTFLPQRHQDTKNFLDADYADFAVFFTTKT